MEDKYKHNILNKENQVPPDQDCKPGRKRSERGQALCCQEERRHQLEQPSQHEQELQPVQIKDTEHEKKAYNADFSRQYTAKFNIIVNRHCQETVIKILGNLRYYGGR